MLSGTVDPSCWALATFARRDEACPPSGAVDGSCAEPSTSPVLGFAVDAEDPSGSGFGFLSEGGGGHVIRRKEGGKGEIRSPLAAANAAASSRAVWKRSSGSRASARAKKASTSGPSEGSMADGGGTGCVQIFAMSSRTSVLWKGSSPVSARYAMTASDQRSLRESTARLPRACSGLM